MDPADLLRQAGGISTRRALVAACGRSEVDRALAAGALVVLARGRYALPVVDEAARQAHTLSGVLSHTSAALHHGWEVLRVPDRPHVTLPTKRKVAPDLRAVVELHRGDLHHDDIDGIATGRELTLTQCLRVLPLDEALAVADSALRHGEEATLRRVAATARGPGSQQVRRVAACASPDAANPFESGLRAHGLDVPGLSLRPQVLIRTTQAWVRPDLVDVDRRVVVEADSFEWHGGRRALRKDAQRYNALVVDGWDVLRFAWEDVMFDPDGVRAVLAAEADLVAGRRKASGCTCSAA